MLSAGAAGTIRIDPQIVWIDFHIHIFLNIRHYIAGYERGLPLSVGIKRRNPYQPVYAMLRFQISVSILPVNLKGHRLNSRFFSVQIVQDGSRKSMALCPAGIHPVQHAAPVTGLSSAGSGIQPENGIVSVIFSCQQRPKPQRIQLRRKLSQHLLDFREHRGIILLTGNLDQQANFLILVLEPFELIDRIL